MKFRRHADGTVSLPARAVTPDELDDYIAHLARLRAQLPWPAAEGWALAPSGESAGGAPAMPVQVARNDDLGSLSLFFRFGGLGGVLFELDVAHAMALGRLLIGQARAGLLSEVVDDDSSPAEGELH